MPAIFISHSSVDREIAAELKLWLEELGYEYVFLDFDRTVGIDPGENWERRLYEEIARCHAVVVVLTPNWHSSKWCFAEYTQARALGKRIFPIAAGPVHEASIARDLQEIDWRAWKTGGRERLAQKIRAITDELARGFRWDPARPPYPGINAFEKEDAAIFFGRDEETHEIIEKLESRRLQTRGSFLLVLGSSGSGKSSLIRAGVVPALERERASWIIVPIIRPQAEPLTALAKALAEANGEPESWRQWKQRLTEEPRSALKEFADELRVGRQRAATLLLCIDQFEEIISVRSTETHAFLGALAVLTDQEVNLPFLVVATSRSDALDELLATPEIAAIGPMTYPLRPMPLDRVRRIIIGPAAVASINLEEGLVERILRDVPSSDVLPLLAFTLRELYDHSKGHHRHLTIADYEMLGDAGAGFSPLENAVRRRAEEVIEAERPSEEELIALRRSFIPGLVRLTADGHALRAIARLADCPAAAHRLLFALVQSRLLTLSDEHGDARIEVAHEALFRAWPKLTSWITAEQEFLLVYKQVEEQMKIWAVAPQERKEEALLQGYLLSRARRFHVDGSNRFGSLTSFVSASIAHDDEKQAQLVDAGKRGGILESMVRPPEEAVRQLFGSGRGLREHGKLVSALQAWGGSITRKLTLILIVATGLIGSATALRIIDPWFIADLRNRTFDVYQRRAPRPYDAFKVRIVGIDDASLAAFGQWPWPRIRLADLTQRLVELGASVVVFDVIFPEPDRTSPIHQVRSLDSRELSELHKIYALSGNRLDHDEAFADAIRNAPVVLSFATSTLANGLRPPVKSGWALVGVEPQTFLDPFVGAVTNIPILDQASSGVGSWNAVADQDGVIRRIPMLVSDGSRIYPSLVAEALRVAFRQNTVMVRSVGAAHPKLDQIRIGEFQIPLSASGDLWLRYDHDRQVRYVSAKDVLKPVVEADLRAQIEGHVVFVGVSAPGLGGASITALGETVPAVSVHAQAMEQILGKSFLARPHWADDLEIWATILLSIAVAALLFGLSPQLTFLVGALAAAMAVGSSWWLFYQHGILLDPVYPLLSSLIVYFAVTGILYMAADRERKFIRQAFGRYVAPELLTKLERSPCSMRLGGEVRPMTIMFMEVHNFTPICEALPAADLVGFINQLLSPMSDAIQAEHGTIDRYVGDSIVAFWNAPLDIPDHAARACRAALRMQDIISRMNSEDAFRFRARNQPDLQVRIGVGINTGDACVGNMGSDRRFNYSAIGEAVDVATRIGSCCKGLGAQLLISEETAHAAPGFAVLETGEITLRGEARPRNLLVLCGDEATASSREFHELAVVHERLLEAIRRRDSIEAAALLSGCRSRAGGSLASLYNHLEKKISNIGQGVIVQDDRVRVSGNTALRTGG